MARLTRFVWNLISERGIDAESVASYQIAAIGPIDKVTLTVWTREGVNGVGELVFEKHDFILDDPAPRPSSQTRPEALAVPAPANGRRAFAVAMRRRVA